MRILVYGAGVQGCELAHRLAQNEKNTVTLLARGEWKERIDQKGLTIVDFGAVVRAAAGVGIVQQVGGLLAVAGQHKRLPKRLQRHLNEPGNMRLIIHDQNRKHRVFPLSLRPV